MAEVDKSIFQKEVTMPFSGQKFTIRRVRFKEFITAIGGLPISVNNSVQNLITDLQDKAKTGDPEAEEKITRFYVSRGAVSPKVWFGPEAECPADQIYYEDLGTDLDMLAGEIITFSGQMALKNMDEFFRGPGAGNPGLDGEALRPAPVSSDTGADV